jgi:hypothetical protein
LSESFKNDSRICIGGLKNDDDVDDDNNNTN